MNDCSSPLAPLDTNAVRSGAREEIRIASRDLGEGRHQTELSVPGVHCAGCIRTVENGLAKLPGVEHVRVNLSTKRASVTWRGDIPPDLLAALHNLGFPGHLTEPDENHKDPEFDRLIRALAVAGFSAMNIMLLSVSVWSGADAATRQAFHWISAALALPCLLYSGRIFFASAWSALRRGRTNMDVPISIGVCLTFALSLYDTIQNGPHAYFDAATSLIFFLLIGRTLDHVMREKARTAVRGLMRLAPRGATVLREDGSREHLRIADIAHGMRIALAVGDRIPVDGLVAEGISDLDCAIVTGESAPKRVCPGDAVQAGTLNLTGPLTITASARAEGSFLAEMVRLMEAAEAGRARYRRLADRAASLYSPVVHATAFLTMTGWLLATGDWHLAISIAIAVLIITCPCALGLAVPIVQVMAARRLFENGVMVKDGSAIERMGEIDTVVFDKTGTLTLGRPRLANKAAIRSQDLAIAARIAQHSSHPFARAIVAERAVQNATDPVVSDVVEQPGLGISAKSGDSDYRLGRSEWALDAGASEGGTVLSRDGRLVARFAFEDALRPEACHAVDTLRAAGLRVAILSGDAPDAVSDVARTLGIDNSAARLLPADKVARLESIAAGGHQALMVGDGINDTPALAAAHVSMAPATAADIGRNTADFVFLRESLYAVPTTLIVSRNAGRLVRQNFGLAVAYNAVALPVAIAGYVTPLIAALAMSLSSLLVVANALRLKSGRASGPATVPADREAARETVLEPIA
ncbi:cation-translocating P-type ATPase [Hyphomicrobium sp.]|uniref:cation-translocating P-type ATPase n=1 Tax=Hyphomicrobium sp. TaxID=82 RepID=UPI002E3640A4|nr:cation-translocating P-type ATPase [Hyphomicrobium sp.]HEX2842705.1 cation-translocating P-type ATPase [Hyphomicrobium sp.]